MKKTSEFHDRFVGLPGDKFDFSFDVKVFAVIDIKITEYSASKIEDLSVDNITSEDLRRALKLQKWLDGVSHSSDPYTNLVSCLKGGVKHV